MTLRDDAIRLLGALRRAVRALEDYNVDDRATYAKDLAGQLRPLVAAFERAVTRDRSRSEAQAILCDIAPVMMEVSGAATKGDMPLFQDDTLSQYWDLYSIFREIRHSQELL